MLDRRGLAYGLLAYTWWGFSPIFWKELDHVDAVDTTGWRIVWTFVAVSIIVAVTRRGREVTAARRGARAKVLAFAAALLIATNWGLWVWAVAADRVTEASLGYFMNPLMNVFLGVVLLREVLRRAQWVAVVLAVIGVIWLTVVVGSLPWVSLLLPLTFALYGLLKKTVATGPLIGLNLETMVLVVPATLLLIARSGSGADVIVDVRTQVFLALTGLVTALPLLAFATAAKHLSLSTLGLLQYVAPTLQFILGVVVYDEAFDGSMLVGYAIIWVGLAFFAVDSLRATRSSAVGRQPARGRLPSRP